MEYVLVYDALTQGRRRLFDWVRPLSQEQYTQPFSFGMGSLRATLLEIAKVELLYAKRLRGEATPPPPIPETFPISATNQPTFTDLERAWTAQAAETRSTLAGITDWNTSVTRRLEQDDKVVALTVTKAQIATQLLLHEVHHRAQAMAMLRQLGVPAQNLDYIGFVVRREEFPKDKTASA